MRLEMLTADRLCFCALEIFMLSSFFHSMFKLRVSSKRFTTYFMIATAAVFIGNSFGSPMLNLMLNPVIFIVFIMAAFRITLNCGIVYTLIFYIIFGGKEVAFELLYRLMSMVTVFSVPPWFTPHGMPYLVIEYIFAILFLLFIEQFTSKIEVNRSDKFCWYLLIMPVASLAILISYLHIDSPQSDFVAFMMCGGAFLLYFSNAAIFIILEKFTEAMEQIKLIQLSDLKKDMEKTNYESIDKANSIYRKYLHDMHTYFNQFRNLAAKGENQTIVNIIDELEGKLQIEAQGIIYSGDTVLNVLLTEYAGRAREQNIHMTISLEDNLNLGFISDGDKISMFGNLLANALEAAQKCREEERYIEVQIYMGNSYFLIFRAENSCIKGICRNGSHFVTTKQDGENHGLGIRIVEELAEKYGGTLQSEASGKSFTSILMLSTYQ